MYKVKWIENGIEKESEEIENREDAFSFQSKLLCSRKKTSSGKWDIELVGVYNMSPLSERKFYEKPEAGR
jgi:hypothetical protein